MHLCINFVLVFWKASLIVVTRFEEKCWSVESEDCKTVYDTVVDKKCESVNLTMSQNVCDTTEEMVMERECKVVNETVITPVCIDIMEKVVEEVSQEDIPLNLS